MSKGPNQKKMIAGVAAELGERIGIDAIFARLAFVAVFLFIEWEVALVAYVMTGIFLHFRRKKETEDARLEGSGHAAPRPRKRVGSVHDARTKLSTGDRRMMAIDQHLNSASAQDLDREIEELRAKIAREKAADAAKTAKGDAS